MNSCLASNGGRRNFCVTITFPEEFASPDDVIARARHAPLNGYASVGGVTAMSFDTWTEQTATAIVRLLERANIPRLHTFVNKIYYRGG